MKRSCNACLHIDCPYREQNQECPCAICVVKVTCIESCDDFAIFRQSENNERHIELSELLTWGEK